MSKKKYDDNPKRFVNWLLNKSKVSYLREWMLAGEGGYQSMIAACESYAWEYGNAKEGFGEYYNYLSREYQVEYRRNVTRFNVYDYYDFGGGEEMDSEEQVTIHTDAHGFSTLGSYATVILDTELGGREVGDEGNESFGGIRAVPTSPCGDVPRLQGEHVEHYNVPDITSLLPEGKFVTLDGKQNPGIRELWEKWLAKRTDEERDIIAVWVRLRSFNEVMDILDCTYEDVERIQSMVQNFGDRHAEKLGV